MDASSPSAVPSPVLRWTLRLHAALIGVAVGVLAMSGSSLFLGDAVGLLTAAAGVIVMVVAALATGLWVGAPGAAAPDPPLRSRWFGAGLATGAAGVFATLWDAYPVAREGVFLRVLALLVLVAIPFYALGLLLPALLAWAEQRLEDLTDDEEEASAWEPLGTLAVALLIGLAAGVAAASLVLVPFLGPGPVLLGTGAALLLPTLLPEPSVPRTSEEVLHEAESALGSIRVVEITYPGQRQPERRLYVNDEEESGELVRSGAPTLPYIAAAEQWFAETARRGDGYLFLGGGAYTLPRRVAERDPKAQITVVELDPEVTRVAYRFFGMRRHYGIRSVHGDARAYLERGGDARFDRIFVDVYGGQEALPYSLVTYEAFAAMARRLEPEGMLTINAIGVVTPPRARRFGSIVRTLAAVFPAVATYTHLGPDYPGRQNVLLAATLDAAQHFPPRAGRFDLWPRDEWPEWTGTLVLHDLLEERATAATPTPRPAAPVDRG